MEVLQAVLAQAQSQLDLLRLRELVLAVMEEIEAQIIMVQAAQRIQVMVAAVQLQFPPTDLPVE
jgi:hypothetical protein